jgi:hypothetical protein
MPLIEAEDKRKPEEIQIKLHPDLAAELRDYGRYAGGSSLHHIVSGALNRLFDADREFKQWRKDNPAGATQVPAKNPQRRGKSSAEVADNTAAKTAA